MRACLETVRERRADPRARADFLPVILSGGGYDVKTSLLLSAPPYVVAGFFTAMMAFLSDKFRKRALFIAISATVCLTGLFIMAYAGPLGVRYVRLLSLSLPLYSRLDFPEREEGRAVSASLTRLPRPPPQFGAFLTISGAQSNVYVFPPHLKVPWSSGSPLELLRSRRRRRRD